jgi:hypothetical protein
MAKKQSKGLRVKALKSFGARVGGENYHVSLGQELDLPAGADWLKAGLVAPVGVSTETAALQPPETADDPQKVG